MVVHVRLALKAVVAISIHPHLAKPCRYSLYLVAETLARETLLRIVVRWNKCLNQEAHNIHHEWQHQATEEIPPTCEDVAQHKAYKGCDTQNLILLECVRLLMSLAYQGNLAFGLTTKHQPEDVHQAEASHRQDAVVNNSHIC